MNMSDLKKYISRCWTNRQQLDPEFSENYEGGYQAFKIGALLKQANYLVAYLGVHIGVYTILPYNWL